MAMSSNNKWLIAIGVVFIGIVTAGIITKKEETHARDTVAAPAVAAAAPAAKPKTVKEIICGTKPDKYDLEVALEKTAHDPDSIEVSDCTDTTLGEGNDCWRITCTVRGKNQLGAKVMTRKTYGKNMSGFSEI